MPQSPPSSELPRRFRGERLLRDGNGVRTWLAFDEETGARVVVKTARASQASARTHRRLEREIEQRRRLHGPGFAAIIALGEHLGGHYVATPYVPGEPLDQRIARRRLTVDEALMVMQSVLPILAELHEQQAIHGDIKPANIIVEGEPIARATLIDFGFARGITTPADDERLGTARYMAPELAGLLGQGVDARADLYAFGLTLYEALAGRHPFNGGTLNELLREHLTITPPSLIERVPDVPRALSEIVARMIRKEPRERYHSAAGVRADLEALLAARREGESDPPLIVGLQDRRLGMGEPDLIGRGRELGRLELFLERVANGEGGLATLEGEAGAGKSRILDELRQRATARGLWVIVSRGVEQSADLPYRMYRDLAEAVARRADDDPAFGAALRQELAEHRDVLALALPELAGLLEAQPTEALESFLGARIDAALIRFVAALGSPTRPVLVAIDDAQWVPQRAFEPFAAWLASAAERGFVGTLVAFRSEEVPAGHALRALTASEALTLPPFGRRETALLVESMAGALPSEVVELVERLGEGNPFFTVAMMHGLAESGAIAPGQRGWTVDVERLRQAQTSRRAASLIARRLQGFTPEARRFLSAGAVLGRSFSIAQALEVAGLPLDRGAELVAEARERQFVWLERNGVDAVLGHDRLREAVLGALEPAELRALHAAAAASYEDRGGQRPWRGQEAVFELAFHYDAAAEHRRALPHALAAAERARAGADFETAMRYYRIAERGLGDDEALRRTIDSAIGDVALIRGEYDVARGYLGRAAQAAATPLERAQAQAKLGTISHRQGDWQASMAELEEAMRLAGSRVPTTRLGFVLALIVALAVQVLHSLLPRWFVGRRPLERGAADFLVAETCQRLTHQYLMGRGVLATLWVQLHGLNLAERYPASPQLAYALVNHGVAMSAVPWRKRSLRYVDRALKMQRALGDSWRIGMVVQLAAVAHQWCYDLERSLELNLEASRLLHRAGDRWEAEVADTLLVACYYRLGRLREAIEVGQRVWDSSSRGGSPVAMVHGLAYWAKASDGGIPEAFVREAERCADKVPHLADAALQADALRLLGLDKPAEAAARLVEARRLVRRLGLRTEQVAPIHPWLATARRLAAAATPPGPARDEALALAWQDCKRALRMSRAFRLNLPHALREAGQVKALLGDVPRARRYFAESLAAAGAIGSPHEHAQTDIALASLDLALGYQEARAKRSDASAALEALRAPNEDRLERSDLSLVDRFATMLESGRTVITSFAPNEVAQRAMLAVMSLLRADRGVFGVRHPDDRIEVLAGDANLTVSRTLLGHALSRDRAVALSIRPDDAGETHLTSESIIMSGARSFLCVPVAARGPGQAFIYVVNTRVRDLFRDEDVKTAEFVATLAGAALENAAGYHQLEVAENEIRQLSRAVADAQEDERNRLAKNLHDGAGQTLTSALLKLAELNREVSDARVTARVSSLDSTLRDLLQDLRGMAYDLRPVVLDRFGLAAALRDLAEHSSSAELRVDVFGVSELLESLDTANTLALYRMAQSALANVIQHAHASNVVFHLMTTEDSAMLAIEDDGVGFDPDTTAPGIGILGMRERAARIGAALTIASRPGRGTTVTIEIPSQPLSGSAP